VIDPSKHDGGNVGPEKTQMKKNEKRKQANKKKKKKKEKTTTNTPWQETDQPGAGNMECQASDKADDTHKT